MGFPGGGFGGGGNMQQLMKQAQKMQADMQRKQKELDELELIGASGGGMVEVVISGSKNIKAVRIKKEAVDPDDVEMLEDLITAAINDAEKQADKKRADMMGPMGGGMF